MTKTERTVYLIRCTDDDQDTVSIVEETREGALVQIMEMICEFRDNAGGWDGFLDLTGNEAGVAALRKAVASSDPFEVANAWNNMEDDGPKLTVTEVTVNNRKNDAPDMKWPD